MFIPNQTSLTANRISIVCGLTLSLRNAINLSGLKILNFIGKKVVFETEILSGNSVRIENLKAGDFLVYTDGIFRTTEKVVVKVRK